MNFKKPCLLLLFLILFISSFCQFAPLVKTIQLADSIHENYSREKIFIHYDRPQYALNDTMWMKGYVVAAKDNAAADSSKIVYLEIIDQTGAVIKRTSTWCATGIFYSNITLAKRDFKQGNYLLRAYTNHMRNFGDSLFFESMFKIIDPDDQQWNLSVQSTGISIKHFFLHASIHGSPGAQLLSKSFEVVVRSKNNVVFQQHVSTDRNGAFAIDTLLDKEIGGDNLVLEVSGENQQKISLPVQLNAGLKTDLQFLPEGGSFITGKLQQLGFKAIDASGKGTTVSGRIINSKKELITTFASVHNGMGIVWMKPELNEQYTAVLNNGLIFKLPVPQPSGTQLQIINQPGTDSIQVVVDASADLYNKNYFFRASAKGISCAMGGIRLVDKPMHLSISKKAFPSGICRFTLYNEHFSPVNERVTLIWHNDTLSLKLTAQKNLYANRDSVSISLSAKNVIGNPTLGSFSVAVIDTSLQPYPRYAENIISYLTLCSDLTGTIEEPNYYFGNPEPGVTEALMLTQGWVNYDYSTAGHAAFAYDTGFALTGKATTISNSPVKNANISLFAKDGKLGNFLLMATTDNKGNFRFNNFPPFSTDSVSVLVKYENKEGSGAGVGLDIDEPVFPLAHAALKTLTTGSSVRDSTTMHFAQQYVQTYNRLKKDKGVLAEVVVTGKAKIPGSKNLNEDGGYDEAITGITLGSMPKASLLDVIYKEIPGVHKASAKIKKTPKPHDTPAAPQELFFIKDRVAIFVIDGYNIYTEYSRQHGSLRGVTDQTPKRYTEFSQYQENILKGMTAEEIVGIEILHSAKNNVAYQQYYEYYGLRDDFDTQYTFVEITTRYGKGPFNDRSAGTTLYKPVAPVVARKFYSPLYNNTSIDNALPDFRTTIFWKPDLVTNEKGEASFSFYTSDNSGGYLIIIQGTDLIGGLGATYLPLQVVSKEKEPGK